MKLGKTNTITDTDRMDAMQRWLWAADLEAGTVEFTVPGFLTGYVRIGADVRQTVDAAIEYERSRSVS